MKFTALFSSFVLMFALSSFAATSQRSRNSATNSNSTPHAKTTATRKKTTSSSQHAKKPVSDVLAPAENLSGTISMIGPSGKEVTLMGSNGVPYDFDLTHNTKIQMGNHTIPASQLASETHKQATVRFLPTAQGNMAQAIQIS